MSQFKSTDTSLKSCPECGSKIKTDIHNELFCENCGLVIESSPLSPFAVDGFGLSEEEHLSKKDGDGGTHPSQTSDKHDDLESVKKRGRGNARQTETLEQIVGTIIEEHKVMKPGQILRYMEQYLPEGWEMPNDDKVRRAIIEYKKNMLNRAVLTSFDDRHYDAHMLSEETINKVRHARGKRPVIGARKESTLIPKDASLKITGTWSNPGLASAKPKKSSSSKAPQKTGKRKKS